MTRGFLHSVVIVGLVSGCSLAVPRAAAAQTTSMAAFSGVLSGAAVVPASGSAASGFIRVDLLSSSVMTLSMRFAGISAGCTGINVRGPGAAGTNGPVQFMSTCLSVTTGSAADVFILTPGQEAELRNGLYYVVVTNAAFPGGEIRAQITPTRGFVGHFTSAGVVPVPSTSLGTGAAIVTVSPDSVAFFTFFFSGVGTLTSMHLHGGAVPGVTGPQIVQVLSGGGDGGYVGVTFALSPSQLALLKAGLLYLDIHTSAFPEGAVRAQLHVPGALTDFDGEGRAEISEYRPSTSIWYAQNPGTASFTATPWGLSTDSVVAGDYDGDGASDNAVFRSGTFFLRHSIGSGFDAIAFGLPTDSANIPGDYDGDGRTDVAVVRPGGSGTPITFYSLNSSNGGFRAMNWGTSGTDATVVGDYDGDGKSDVVIYRIPTNTYYILNSATGTLTVFPFGVFATDFLTPGDYDGDGRTDFAVYRFAGAMAGTWFIWQSSTNSLRVEQFGTLNDVPAPGDYDGDGKSDLAVIRINGANLNWYIRRSSDGGTTFSVFGLNGDAAPAVVVVR